MELLSLQPLNILLVLFECILIAAPFTKKISNRELKSTRPVPTLLRCSLR